MKRSIVLVLAASLTTIVAFVILMLTVTPLVRFTQVEQAVEIALEPPLETRQTLSLAQANQIRAQRAEFEAAVQEREAVLKDQIAQSQQALVELDRASQTQIAELNSRLAELNAQVEQAASNNQSTQTHVADLRQAIENDATTYQTQLTTLQTSQGNAERQLQQAIEQTNTQLQTTYDEIGAQQVAAATAPQQSYSGGEGYDDNDDHYEHDDYEEYEDDDDD